MPTPKSTTDKLDIVLPSLSLSRRQFLLTGLGASVFTTSQALSTAQSWAANGLHASSSIGMRAVKQFMVGTMRVTMIDDGSFSMSTKMFGSNVKKDEIAELLQTYGLDTKKAKIPLQVMLVETGAAKVLIDTGMGDITFPGDNPDNGRLASSLRSLGIARDDIDAVILTHGHPDHVGGATVDGEKSFKNATYYMPAAELEFWTQSPNKAPPQLKQMIKECRNHLLPISHGMASYKDGDEIAPGITMLAAPGHTLDHHAVMLSDGGEKLLNIIDTAVHYIIGLEQPDWATGAEMNKDQARETRRKLIGRASDDHLLIAGYHFPFPGIGRVVPYNKGWRFVPVSMG